MESLRPHCIDFSMVTWFTHKAGSLIHPLLMLILATLWVVTWLLGLQVKKTRSEESTEATPLMSAPRPVLERYHHKLSASLLFLTSFSMFLGMFNTYQRSGRLFPGPHLYGGFFLLLAVSLNVAMVPWFKDAPSARGFHAVVGFAVILTIAWQIWSGLPILKSVWKTVPW